MKNKNSFKPVQKDRLGNNLFEDFENQFAVIFAESPELKKIAFAIRNKAYREDLGVEPSGNVIDAYDAFASHLLLVHRPSNSYAGTIRLIIPRQVSQKLPFQQSLIEQNWLNQQDLACVKIGEYSEVSKLAVSANFRRRARDRDPLSETLKPIEEQAFAIGTHRDFPKITMGLCLAAIALARQLFHERVFTVMPPMLSQKLKGYGLLFEQASHVFNRQGAKALYQLKLDQGVQIAESIYPMNDYISNQLASQLHLLPDVNEV